MFLKHPPNDVRPAVLALDGQVRLLDAGAALRTNIRVSILSSENRQADCDAIYPIKSIACDHLAGPRDDPTSPIQFNTGGAAWWGRDGQFIRLISRVKQRYAARPAARVLRTQGSSY